MMNWSDLLSTKRCASPHKSTDIRTSFQRDYDRIVFSSAFRRLQNKTQVFPLPGSQIVHNRLTHSLEVASVGRSIARMASQKLTELYPELGLSLNEIDSVVSAACLAHDLGNPPFGHSGENAISSYFKDGEGRIFENQVLPAQWSDLIAFEGNANALRLLTHQFVGRRPGGFSLTAATLATLIKYPYHSFDNGRRKKYNVFYSETSVFEWIMKECGIPKIDVAHGVYARHPLSYLMESADDICYLILDMEDAHKRGIVSTEAVEHCFLSFFNPLKEKEVFDHKNQVYNDVTDVNERVSFLRATLINKLVNAVSDVFVQHYGEIIEGTFAGSLIACLPDFEKKALNQCRDTSVQGIYQHPSVVKIELTGFNVIGTLLHDFINAVMKPNSAYNRRLLSLMPKQFEAKSNDTYVKIQAVLDFISNMTDLYAVQMYKDLRGIE